MGYDLAFSAKNIQVIYRRLIFAGFTKEEAGNLIAIVMGLHATQKGWTTKQIKDMLFLKEIDKTLPP